MTSLSLAHSYLLKARSRLKILQFLQDDRDYSDVIREAQEVVELCLKGMLRFIGVEPPKWHDVGPLIIEHRAKFHALAADTAEHLAVISARLRKEREVAFYGDEDFIPSDEYQKEDGEEAIKDATLVVSIAESIIH